MSALAVVTFGFWRRTGAMLLKEFLQLRRKKPKRGSRVSWFRL